MTEREWQACSDPALMLAFLRGRASDRKLRLFFCVECRLACAAWTGRGNLERGIEVAEQWDDGLASESDRSAALEAAARSAEAAVAAGAYGWAAVAAGVRDCLQHGTAANTRRFAHVEHHHPARSHRVRDIFGPLPFRAVRFDLQWRTSTAVALATRMYETRDFGPMPILADALQDAGCDNEDVISHCRGEGPHVRGCWVLDLILGKQ